MQISNGQEKNLTVSQCHFLAFSVPYFLPLYFTPGRQLSRLFTQKFLEKIDSLIDRLEKIISKDY